VGGRLAAMDVGLPDVPAVQDVNERRQVLVGGDRVWHDGRVTVAPAPPDGGRARFVDLDDGGRAVGQVVTPRPGQDPDTVSEAAVWRVGGGIRTLGSLPGFESSRALAVNEAGMVAGSSSSVAGGVSRTRSWVWRDGRMTDVGSLGGAQTWISVGRDGLHRGPSLRGEVVGQSVTATGESHAFHWRRGRITDLGTLAGGRSWAIAVNDRGQVIGGSQNDTDRGARAFLWQDGRMIDLTALAGNPPMTEVFDIDDRGQVVGRTSDPSTPGAGERIVVWTVPPR
jgi:probable HAF family extracellular repeat protein